MNRSLFVGLHRWAGLAMAGFLILVGLTGSLLSFWLEINHWATPELYPPARPGVELDAAALARRAEAIAPQARATTVYLGVPGSASIGMEPREEKTLLGFEYIHLDPIDGHELGRTNWHGWPRTRNDVMPFIYGLHMYLAMSGIGDWVLGFVALTWTLDCFAAFYLTLPRRGEHSRKGFVRRWKSAWLVKVPSSFFRVNFDLHRASGLWLWIFLLIYAWSSVYFTLPTFYTRVTQTFADFDQPVWSRAGVAENDRGPVLGWEEALATGQRLMAEQGRLHGFAIERPLALYHLREQGIYEYRVRSSRDIGDKAGATEVYFDARDGAYKGLSLPTGRNIGTTMTTWLVELHTANVFGLPYRLFVCLLGLAIALLSITGVYIWWKKRSARRERGRRPALGRVREREEAAS